MLEKKIPIPQPHHRLRDRGRARLILRTGQLHGRHYGLQRRQYLCRSGGGAQGATRPHPDLWGWAPDP
jgi:hypothetical protein